MSTTPDTAGSTAAPAVKPATPPKPAPKPPAKAGKTRRFFLLSMFGSWFAIAWMALTARCLGMLLGTVRFLFPNVLSEPPSRFKVGFPKQYEDGKVVERFKDQNTWIVRNNGTDLRPEHHLHPPRLHAQLAGARGEVQVPLSRQRLQHHRRQFRRPGTSAAGALGHQHRRRRPDRRR